jgi:outer membrane protein assembly factor BamB
MRRQTGLALAAVFGLLALVVVVGVGFTPSGELTEQWVSDTPRENEINHHGVGIGPAGDVIVAPVAEVPYADVPITNSSCELVRLDPDTGSTVWEVGMPAEDCYTHALTEPTIEDIDDDGELEVVVSSTENALITYDAETGSEEWRVPLSTYGYGRPTVANVTPALGPEIVTSDIEGGVVVVDGDGMVEWRAMLNATQSNPSVWLAPLVDDFNADGSPEVLLASSNGPVLLSSDGDVKWQSDGAANYLAVAQVDDDPESEVFATGRSAVRSYGVGGELAWERDLSNSRFKTALDGDGDGTVELYVGRIGGRLLALDATTGDTEWSTRLSTNDEAMVQPPVLADVDGETGQEIVTVIETGTVVVVDPDTGSERARYERDVPVWTAPSVADINDDGRNEIIVRYGDGRVIRLDYGV